MMAYKFALLSLLMAGASALKMTVEESGAIKYEEVAHANPEKSEIFRPGTVIPSWAAKAAVVPDLCDHLAGTYATVNRTTNSIVDLVRVANVTAISNASSNASNGCTANGYAEGTAIGTATAMPNFVQRWTLTGHATGERSTPAIAAVVNGTEYGFIHANGDIFWANGMASIKEGNFLAFFPVPFCSNTIKATIILHHHSLCVGPSGGRVEYTGQDCGGGRILWTSARTLDITAESWADHALRTRMSGLLACNWDWTNDGNASRVVFGGSCGVAPTVPGGEQLPMTCQAPTPEPTQDADDDSAAPRYMGLVPLVILTLAQISAM